MRTKNRVYFNTKATPIQIVVTIYIRPAVVLVRHSILHGIILTNPPQIIKLYYYNVIAYIMHITPFFRSNTRTVL